jgi:histone-lysine N-methyltransferase MLL3
MKPYVCVCARAHACVCTSLSFFSAGRVPLFSAPHLPAPPLPPENIMTEQDRQTQIHYEQWLNHQNQIVSSQLKYYETEVSKLRKIRKVSSA